MKRANLTLTIVAFFLLVLIALIAVPPGDSYTNVDVDTCGSKDTPCHGPIDEGVSVRIDGPDVVETSSNVNYLITVEGGPSQTYGYFVLFTDPDGNSRDLQGNLLFSVEPNSVTRISGGNTFIVEFTAPHYAVDLTMKVSAVSSDNSGNPTGDGWNFAEKEIEVRYPLNTEFPGMEIPESAYLIGLSVLTVALVLWMVFFVVDRKLKKEVP